MAYNVPTNSARLRNQHSITDEQIEGATMKSKLMRLTLFVLLVAVAGCDGKNDKLDHKMIYDNRGGVSYGLYGESDSSIIAYQTWGTADTQWVRFTFDKDNYWKASSVIQMYCAGFGGLNLMAQKEYVENLKYIHSGKWAMRLDALTSNGT